MTTDPPDLPPPDDVGALQQIIRQKDAFLVAISHELRAPMNGVFGMADALSRTALDAKQQRYLDVLRDACDTMLLITNQLLEMGKLDAGQTILVPVDFDIAEFAARQVDEYADRAAQRGLLLSLDTKILTASRIYFDRMRLGQVLGNLISNAIRYTDEGFVMVRVFLQNGHKGKLKLVLEVEDSGIGIAPEMHSQIFEAFSSADATQSALRGGTGIGLNVVSKLVALMGGQVRVASTLGAGTTFTVELSVDPAQGTAGPRPQPRRPLSKDLRILLAEDNDSNAFVFEVLLEDTGARITRVRDGEAAVAAFQKGGYDLVFMDIQMPVMNGIQATAAIRKIEGNDQPPLPIIALSADLVAVQCPEYIAAKFTGCITKPFRQSDLLDMLANFDKDFG